MKQPPTPRVETPVALHRLHCREIWGGYTAADASLAVPGMEGYVLARPHDQAATGGDIHYVGLCGHGMLSRYVVADVSGHGAAVAHLAAELRALLSRHLDTPDQSDLMRALNDEFAALSETGVYATAIVMSYLHPADHLLTVNAGHPRPLWYSVSDGQWRMLTHELPQAAGDLLNLPLGAVPGTDYRQFALPLEEGDLVVVYTDSLTEARSPEGDVLGEQGLFRIARDLGPLGPDALAHALHHAARTFAGGTLSDDVTILALRHTREAPADPHRPTATE